jgi:hypothetical protein
VIELDLSADEAAQLQNSRKEVRAVMDVVDNFMKQQAA